MTPPSHGSCVPLLPRSDGWRAALADELDGLDDNRSDAGLILEVVGYLPDDPTYQTIREVIRSNAAQILGRRNARIDDAVEELGQVRAAIRVSCPESERLLSPGA